MPLDMPLPLPVTLRHTIAAFRLMRCCHYAPALMLIFFFFHILICCRAAAADTLLRCHYMMPCVSQHTLSAADTIDAAYYAGYSAHFSRCRFDTPRY